MRLKEKIISIIQTIGKAVGVILLGVLFSILVFPPTQGKHNAHDRGIISYIANNVRELVEYANYVDPPDDDFKYIQLPPRGLKWLPEGYTATDNSHFTLNVGVPVTIYNSEYIKGNETIQLKVTQYEENDFSNYVEVDGDVLEVMINDKIYNYTSDGGVNRFLWNIDNCSYNLVGYDTDIEILKDIIKYNFDFGG